MIDSYDFGKMNIMGEVYDFDLLIVDSEVEPWIRDESHIVTLKDLKKVSDDVEIVIIGTGDQGCVDVDEKIEKYFKKKKVELVVERTVVAVKQFNNLVHTGKRVCGVFHLTC